MSAKCSGFKTEYHHLSCPDSIQLLNIIRKSTVSLAEDIIFQKFVILSRLCLLHGALYLRLGKPACHMGTCCKGMCWNAHKSLCCTLTGLMTNVTLQPARRYMGFFVTPDKTTTAWEGEGTSSWTGSAQLAVRKSIHNQSRAA